jgi:hypothetical protein
VEGSQTTLSVMWPRRAPVKESLPPYVELARSGELERRAAEAHELLGERCVVCPRGCKSSTGRPPILGCEVYFSDDRRAQTNGNAHVTLLAADNVGGNLIKLGSAANLEGYCLADVLVVTPSMATSSGEDVPCNLKFPALAQSPQRRRSRAQCLAYVVASPRLLEVGCRSIE